MIFDDNKRLNMKDSQRPYISHSHHTIHPPVSHVVSHIVSHIVSHVTPHIPYCPTLHPCIPRYPTYPTLPVSHFIPRLGMNHSNSSLIDGHVPADIYTYVQSSVLSSLAALPLVVLS